MTPAIDERSAARILDLSQPPRGSRSRAIACFAVILALAAHAALVGGFPASAHGAAMSSAGARTHARETAQMKRLMAIGAAAALSAGASAQDAVQWRVEVGGNGHWYIRSPQPVGVSWTLFLAAATAQNAQLVSLSSQAEESFVFSQFGACVLGLRAAAGSADFTWVEDPTNRYLNWGTASCDSGPYPNNPTTFERFVELQAANCPGSQGITTKWDDYQASEWGPAVVLMFEFSADCDNDGIVDYGQIRAGELADTNANNIPDCCESGPPCGCAGDTNNDSSIDGIDLATILTRWAQPAAKFPEADCNHDGVIDGSDLAIVLGAWGGCP